MITPLKLTHIAKAALKCYTCGAAIQAGEKFRRYRERATSSHEACHAGMYPHRNQCVGCVDKINASRTADVRDARIMTDLIRPEGERTSHVHKAAHGMSVPEWTEAFYSTIPCGQ